MASKYAVETVFKAVDAMTAPIKKIETQMNGLKGVSKAVNSKIKNDMRQAEKSLNAFENSCKRAAKNMLAIGAAAGVAAIVDSTKKYVEFEDSVTQAGAKFKDLDVTSENFTKDLERMQAAAMEVGSKTKFSAQDAAGALDKMAMAGLTSDQAIGMLMGTTNLAAATNMDLTNAVDMATDAIGAFGLAVNDPSLTAEEVAQQTTKNMNRIADVVAKTTNMANTDMSQWFEAVKSGAPTFTSMGGTLEEFSGMVGILANSGIKGAEAGTALRNMMLNLGAPSSSATKALSKLGISVYDQAGNMLPIIDIMEQFEKKLGDVDEQTKNGALEDIFGKRNVGAFLTLMQSGTKEIRNYVDTLEQAGGTAQNMATAMNKSLKGQITLFKSAVEGIQLRIGKAVADNGGSTGLQKMIDMINNVNVDKVTQAIIGVMNVLSGAIRMIVGFVQVVWALRGPIIAIVGAITLYKTVIMGTVIAMKAWQAIQVIIKAAQIGWIVITSGLTAGKAALTAAVAAETAAMTAETGATTAATAAQTGFNIAMLANPVTWIVLGIIALIAAIVALAMNWDKVTAAMKKAWEWLKNIASIIFDVLIGALQKLWEPIARIINAFKEGGFVAGIKQIGVTLLKWVLTPVQKMLGMLSHIPGIGGKIAEFNSGIDEWLESMSFQGGEDKKDSEKENEPGVTGYAPVTPAERYSYSQSTQISESRMTIGLEKGVQAKVSGPAPGITIQNTSSGAF